MYELPLMSHSGGGCKMFGSFCQMCIISQYHPAAAAGDDLVAVKTDGPEQPHGACMLVMIETPQRFSGIFNYRDVVGLADGQESIHFCWHTEGVHWQAGSYASACSPIPNGSIANLGMLIEISLQMFW